MQLPTNSKNASDILQLASDWKVLFQPQNSGCYINDHSIIQGLDKKWHLIGITGLSEKADPEQERWFAHGEGNELFSETSFHELGAVCNDGNRAWAPGIIEHDGRYFMLYGPGPTKLAISRDLGHWMGESVSLIGNPPEACHRDHMIVKLEDSTWLLYATGLDSHGAGAISVFISNDLRSWRFVRFALQTKGKAALRPAWGATESPFVFTHQNWYYLSITYTDCRIENYHDTIIFRSTNPFDFGTYDADCPEETVIQKLKAHAPEYLHDPRDDCWYVTTCGWRGYGVPHEGAVSIAKLKWNVVE